MSGLREAVVRAARATVDRGLNQGTSGNVSARAGGGILITPSAVPYGDLDPADLVLVEADGSVLQEGGGPPSTEWRLHASIYRSRPDVEAILHAHPPFSTTLSCLRREIPGVHYLVAAAGGESIPCARYAPFGTKELAQVVAGALEDRSACLMANHGLVAVGSSLAAALELATRVEAVAEVYWRALQAGEPALLSTDQMADVRERLSG